LFEIMTDNRPSILVDDHEFEIARLCDKHAVNRQRKNPLVIVKGEQHRDSG